ncbi:hypothetical protein AC1031_021579 [Aphanomyces cochlioides]|nr:hypothetical protein AC1031_021579 [Aphanomyces cochlioides]
MPFDGCLDLRLLTVSFVHPPECPPSLQINLKNVLEVSPTPDPATAAWAKHGNQVEWLVLIGITISWRPQDEPSRFWTVNSPQSSIANPVHPTHHVTHPIHLSAMSPSFHIGDDSASSLPSCHHRHEQLAPLNTLFIC